MNAQVRSGFKLTDVGVVPEDWEVVALSNLSEFITSGSRGWARYYSDEGALFVRSQNVRDGRLDLTDSQFVNPPQGSEGSRTRVKLSDLLITITGNSVGNVALVEQELGETYISQHVGLVRLREPLSGQYVCRFLSPGALGNGQISGSQSGQSKPGLTLKNLHGFWIALPPLPEQRAIVAALSDMDALIGGLDQLITKKRDIKQAAMQQLLTGQQRLTGFSGEWEVKRLEDLAELVMGQSPSSSNYNKRGDGLPLIQGNADIIDRKTIERIFTTEVTKLGKCGDILLSVRAPVGEVARATFDICLGRGVCAIRGGSEFLYHYLISMESSWGRLSKGSTFDSINSAELRSLDIRLPSSEGEQTAIANILSDMDNELATLETRRDKARKLKQGMMQELFTGRIRLPHSSQDAKLC